ncbi:NADP-dependent oxidoreductase [Arthrobacter rhombi]|uniref:NADP-dependent oxidoreductase n=1 Tax=Arthrobacter rhombi TaxID=71253 RepID=UPI003FD65242
MTAIQIQKYGPTDQVIVADSGGPSQVGEGQLLIRVAAASINPVDTGIALGYMAEAMPLDFPITLGTDYSGIVEKVGPGVESFSVGDLVIGQAGVALGGSGTFAEYAVGPAVFAAHAPKTLPLVEAATLPLVGASALQAIESLRIIPGMTVLVLGGGGAIGSLGVQLAQAIGAKVIATAGAADHEDVLALGASEVYDYADSSWREGLSAVDVILDASPGLDPAPYYGLLRPGGTMVSLSTQHDEAVAAAAGISAETQISVPVTEVLDQFVAAVDAGHVILRIGTTLPLARAAEAFAADKTTPGKTLLIVADLTER